MSNIIPNWEHMKGNRNICVVCGKTIRTDDNGVELYPKHSCLRDKYVKQKPKY